MGHASEIKIGTKIGTDKASASLMTLQNRIIKTSEKINSLRNRMTELNESKAPTAEYANLQAEIDKAETAMGKLVDRQIKMQETGKAKGRAWNNIGWEIEQAEQKIQRMEEKARKLVDTGKAFELGSSTAEFENLSKELQRAESEMSVLVQRQRELKTKQEQTGSSGKNAFDLIGTAANKASRFIEKILVTMKKLTVFLVGRFNKALGVFDRMNKSVSESSKNFGRFGTAMRRLLFNFFIFNHIRKVFTDFSKAISDGLKNLALYSADFNKQMSEAVSASATLKNMLAAAAMPIAQQMLPYITSFLNVLIKCIEAVSHLFAALTGRSTYTRAIKQNIDYADSLDKVGAAAKDTEGSLHSLDKLNKMSSNTAGGASGIGDLFEEVPIDSQFKNMADRIKNLLKQIFAPFKTAWNRQGKFVIDSWKYGLNEIWQLIRDIGRDFLIMWNQEETVKIFENIHRILGNIGLISGNLAKNFRAAWNENRVGLRIFEAMRDILGVIVAEIRKAVEWTEKWSRTINFSPLLEAIHRWLVSMKPVAQAVAGVFADMWKSFLAPVVKWVIEKALPELLRIWTDLNNKIDWEYIRRQINRVWEALARFTMNVGEGLLRFIDTLSGLLADWINGGGFEKFIDWLVNTLDGVTAESVYNALMQIYEGILTLKKELLKFYDENLKAWLIWIKDFLASKTLSKHIEDLAFWVKYLFNALLFFKGLTFFAGLASGIIKFAAAWKIAFGAKAASSVMSVGTAFSSLATAIPASLGIIGAAIGGFAFGMLIDKVFIAPLWETDSKFSQWIDRVIAKTTGFDKDMAGSFTFMDAVAKHISDGKVYSEEQLKEFIKAGTMTAEQAQMIANDMNARGHAIPTKFAEGITAGVPGVVDAGMNVGEGFDKGFKSKEGQVNSTFKSFADNLITKFKGFFKINSPSVVFTKFGENIIDGLDGGLNKFKNILATIKTVGKSLIDNTKSTLGISGNTSSIFKGFGGNIMSGLMDGINGMKSTVTSTLSNIANSVKNTFSDLLKIKSPSRVFMGFGTNIVEGLNIGIKDMMGTTNKLMCDFADSLGMDVDLSPVMGGVGNGQVSSALNASRQVETASQMSNMADGMAQTIVGEIIVKCMIDRREIGRAVADFNNLQLAR